MALSFTGKSVGGGEGYIKRMSLITITDLEMQGTRNTRIYQCITKG